MNEPFPRGAPGEAALTDPLVWNNAFTSSLSGRFGPRPPRATVAVAAAEAVVDPDLFELEARRHRLTHR